MQRMWMKKSATEQHCNCAVCGAKRTARAAQLPDPDPHLNRELSCIYNMDLAERSSEGESDDSEN